MKTLSSVCVLPILLFCSVSIQYCGCAATSVPVDAITPDNVTDSRTPDVINDLDVRPSPDRLADSDRPDTKESDGSSDTSSDTPPVCEINPERGLTTNPESIDFGEYLIGQHPEQIVLLTNTSGESLELLSVVILRSEFEIVAPPSMPKILNPCDQIRIKMKMSEEGETLSEIVSRLRIEYSDDKGSHTTDVMLKGVRLTPEMVACEVTYLGTGEMDISGGQPIAIILSNDGYGDCIVDQIIVADCTESDGKVTCPAPKEALRSAFFTHIKPSPGSDGEPFTIWPGRTMGIFIGYNEDNPNPPVLPAYGVVAILQHERITGIEKTFPHAVIGEDGQTSFPWNLKLVE